MTRVLGYVRVSTAEQAEKGWNLDEDKRLIHEMCETKGWELVAIFSDPGLQGDDPDRPGLLKLLAALDSADLVLMRQQDRISRDPIIWGTCAAAFQKAGVRVETFTGPIDLDTPQGRFVADMMAAVGKLEKGQIAQRVRQSKDARTRAGLPPGGKRPYGYRYESKLLVVDRVEAAVVVRMFEMALATSQRRIAHLLNAEGIPAAKGGRWVQSMVARILGNPIYIGVIRRRRPDGGWDWYEGKHEAIVDEALWRRVNASRATKERREGGRPLETSHLLTRGKLRCGRCGSAMQPVASYHGRPETYKCLGRQSHGPTFCQQPSVRRELIDEALLAQLTSRYFDLDGTRERLRSRQASELPNAEAAVAEAEREVASAEARIAKVTRGWQDDVISDDEYGRQRTTLEDELRGAQEAVTQAEGRVEDIRAEGASTDAEEALLSRLADLKQLVSGTVDQARDIESLRTVIRQLFAHVDLVDPDHFLPGVREVMPDNGEAHPAPYWLLPKPRAEVVDWQTMTVIRQPVPEDLTLPTCR
jgi:site-specific DNA recombinase